ncbi:MAG TPA: DNA topoisomerase IB [Acidimicrobiia bacterium]|nr:DNA topoisomerase IB [Acidimicrobiia bacterium]
MADSLTLVERARLRYSTDEESGIRRRRRGKGFSYQHDLKGDISKSARSRIDSLVIPPAWTDVWICETDDGHIQATGRDAAGRKQYVYHPQWELIRDEAKFERLKPFGSALPRLRKQVATDLRLRGLPHQKVLALAVAVLDQSMIRVGNKRYEDENGSFGLTTLEAKHAEVEGDSIKLFFASKGGVAQEVALRSRRLADLVSKCQELSGQKLFSYSENGNAGSVTSDEINGYLRRHSSEDFTAKDFRTWGASALATNFLGGAGPPNGESDEGLIIEAIDTAADALGNTRAVCRASYVHPAVPEAFSAGTLFEAWRSSRSSRLISRAERTLLRVLP